MSGKPSLPLYKNPCRIIALFTAFLHFFTILETPVLQASAPVPAAAWTLPAALGEITEQNFPAHYQPGMPLVVHVQDAHTLHDAQKRIQEILNYLQKEKEVRLLLLEGGSGPAQTNDLHIFTDKTRNEKLWRRMVRSGEMGGGEIFLLENETPGMLGFGAENSSDYEANLRAYRKVMRHKEKWEKPLADLGFQITERLRQQGNPELINFTGKWFGFQTGKEADRISRQLDWMMQQADPYLGLQLKDKRNQAEWPQLVRYRELQHLQRRLDLEKRGDEFAQLQSTFKTLDIPADFWDVFQPQSASAKKTEASSRSPRTLLETFDQKARPAGFRYGNFPALRRWFAWVVLQDELDPLKLSEEMEALGLQILDRLAAKPDEKENAALLKDWHQLARFLKLEVSREEARKILENLSLYRPSSLARSIAFEQEGKAASFLDSTYEAAASFYQLAQKRDRDLSVNAEKLMKENKVSQAILVTGGFHTDGLREEILKQGMAWISIQPRIHSLEEDENYERVMLGALPKRQALKSPLYATPASTPEASVRRDLVLASMAARWIRRVQDINPQGRLRVRRLQSNILDISSNALEKAGWSVRSRRENTSRWRLSIQRLESRPLEAYGHHMQTYFEQKAALEKAAEVMFTDEHYPLLVDFWGNKIKLEKLPEPLQKAFADYRTAFQGMKESAVRAAALNIKPSDRDQAFAALKDKKNIPDKLIRESTEIQRAGVETWSDKHQQLVDQNSRRMASLLARGSDAASLAKDMIRRSGPMRLEDFIPQDLSQEPQSREIFFDRFEKFGLADEYRMWAQTTMSRQELSHETKILAQPLEDLVPFRVAHLHELIHDVAHQGRLPILPDHELITHAITAAELVRDAGLDALRRFGDEIHVRLYEHGRELYKAGKPVNDLDWLLEETKQVYLKVESEGKLRKRTKNEEAAEGEPEAEPEKPREMTPEMQQQNYFNFERLAGSMLGGYGAEREAQEKEDSLVYFVRYATDVLSRHDAAIAPMMQSEEGRSTASRLQALLMDLARTITRDRQLQFEQIKDDEQRKELPEVRYLPEEHKIVAPESLWYLHEDVARGLVAQEIARALHARPDLIAPELVNDSAFMELWYSTDAFRVVQAAYEQNPGLMGNVSRYYDYRHTIINMDSARRQMNQLPVHLQYLAGLIWEWHRNSVDPRIRRPEVLEALSKTRSALALLKTLKDPEAYQKKIQTDIWPLMKVLKEQAVQDGMLTEVMQDMAQAQEIQLSQEQQAWDQTGQLQIEDMDEEQQDAIEQKLEDMTPEERQKLEEEIRKRLEEMTRLYREKQGGQGLGDMRIKMGQQGAGKGKGAHSFPMSPTRSPSGLAQTPRKSMTLAEALQALIKEAEALEKLAAQTQETADQLAQNADSKEKEPLELVKSLNEQAQALRDEAARLREKAQQFEQAVREAKRGADASRVKDDAQALADSAKDFVEQTEKFEGGADAFAKMSEGLEGRVEEDASSLTPQLAGAVSGNAKKLQQDSRSLHDHAGQISQLTESLARAFAQMGQAGQPGGQAQPGGEGKGQGQPQEAELKDITHEHVGAEEVSAVQLAQASDPNAGGRGYGSGRTTHTFETKLKPKKLPQFRPPANFTPPDISKPKQQKEAEKPVPAKAKSTAEERSKALSQLQQLLQNARLGMESPQIRRRLSQMENNPAEQKKFYQGIVIPQAPAIKRIKTEFLTAIQQTETGGKITGLIEGEYIDSDMLGHIKDLPAAIMAIDIAPQEYDAYISLLIDLSGSMLSPLPVFMPKAPPGIHDSSAEYYEWLASLQEEDPEQGVDLEKTYLYQAGLAAAVLRESTKIHGVKSEEYGFHFNPAIPFRNYEDIWTPTDAARINFELFAHTGGGTNDTEAIAQAVRRMARQRLGRPGLRIIGIGLGPGTEKVREAYYPNGYYADDVAQLPHLMKKILKEQLTGSRRVPNIIIVLTDGNPGANNNAFIQGMMQVNEKRWDKRFLAPPKKRHEVREAKLPFEYVREKQGTKIREFLVIQGHKIPTGKGGPLSPKIEIIPTSQLELPPPPKIKDHFPAEYVARIELAEGAKAHSFLVPLSPYNMRLLSQMMEILELDAKSKPNLYLRGPAAGGKNTLLYLLSALAKRPVHLMSLNYDTNERQLVAMQTYGESGKEETNLRPSPMIQAAMDPDGAWGAADEVNKPANPGVLSAWYSLAEQRFITMEDSSVILAPADFRMIALGNPNRPPYVVSEVPVDFDRRFQFVDVPYLHGPKQKKETNEQVKERLDELAFLLRLQAPTLYARERFYTYTETGGAKKEVSGKYFIEQLILFAQDLVVAFEDGALPRPMSVRGLMRIARHLEHFPEDVGNFQEVLGGAYNIRRIAGDVEQTRKFEEFLGNRLPGLSDSTSWMGRLIPLAGSEKKLTSAVVEKTEGEIKKKVYQIYETAGGSAVPNRILVEYPLPALGKKNLPVGKLPELQSVLRKKMALVKALLLGENVLIYAHSGMGKTTLVLDLLVNDLLSEPYQMQMNANSTVASLYGRQKIKDGKTSWEKPPLLLALENNRPLLIDDIGKPKHQAVNSVLNNALQFGQITTPYGVISGDAPVIATTTPEEVRYGANPLSGEVEDRFKLFYFDWMTPGEEKEELEHLFPQVSTNLISRFVEAVGELREKEEMKSEFMRPVTLQDMIVTLERFIRTDRELMEIFLSAYGIEPISEYAESVEQTLLERKFQNPSTGVKLGNERFSNYAPPPKPQDILNAAGDDAKMNLLRRLIASFKGSGKKESFRVQLNSAKPYGIAKAGKNAEGGDIYEIQAPQSMGPVGLTYQLKSATHFSGTERTIMQRLYESLSKSPTVEHGEAPILAMMKRVLARPDEEIISVTNLQAAVRYLRANGIKAVDQEQFKKALTWISGFELYSFSVKELAGKILTALDDARPEEAIVALTRTLPMDPPALKPVEAAFLDRVRILAKTYVPGFDAHFDSVTRAYYASRAIADRLAMIGVHQNSAVVFFDGTLAEPVSRDHQGAYEQMHALLFAREVVRMVLRKSSTSSYDLNEELALMAEIDKRFWANLSGADRRELILLSGNMVSTDPKFKHLGQFFSRLKTYAELSDEAKTWERAATDLRALTPYKSSRMNAEHVVTFRRSIRSLNTFRSDPDMAVVEELEEDEDDGLFLGTTIDVPEDEPSDLPHVSLEDFRKIIEGGEGPKPDEPTVLKTPADEAAASGQLPDKPVAFARRAIQLADRIQNASFVQSTAVSKVARLVAFGTEHRVVGGTRMGKSVAIKDSQTEFPVIYLWDVRSKKVLKVIDGFKKPVISVAFDATGTYLAALDGDGYIYVWNVDDLKNVKMGSARRISPHPSLGIKKIGFVNPADLPQKTKGKGLFPTLTGIFSGAPKVEPQEQELAGFVGDNIVWHQEVAKIPVIRAEARPLFPAAKKLTRQRVLNDLGEWTSDPQSILRVARYGTRGVVSSEWRARLHPDAYIRMTAWVAGQDAGLWDLLAQQTSISDLQILENASLTPVSSRTAAAASFGLSLVSAGSDYSEMDFRTAALLLSLPQNRYKLQAVFSQGIKEENVRQWNAFSKRYLDGRLIFLPTLSEDWSQSVNHFFAGQMERDPKVSRFLSSARRLARQARIKNTLTLENLRAYTSVIGNRSEMVTSLDWQGTPLALRLVKEGQTANLGSYQLDAVMTLKTAGLSHLAADTLDPETLRSLETLESGAGGSVARVIATPELTRALAILTESVRLTSRSA